jgi:hypothetical protein
LRGPERDPCRASLPSLLIRACAKADVRVSVGTARCHRFPDRLGDVRETSTPKGRGKVDWIVRKCRRESWDVWLEVSTGLLKLIPHVH